MISATYPGPDVNPVDKNCNCERCLTHRHEDFMIFITCSKCGNKRCPHAKDHHFKCTNSNDVGQVGEYDK